MKLWFRAIAVAFLCSAACLSQNGPPPITTDLWTVPRPSIQVQSIVKIAADYNEEARMAELEGTVSLRGTIGDDGHPHNLKIIEPLGLGLDEQAMEVAAQEISEPQALGRTEAIQVVYHLPSKSSRWHLIHAEFQPPDGASRPTFVKTIYPTGAGILSGAVVDEARLLGAIGRQAFATIAFSIDERKCLGPFPGRECFRKPCGARKRSSCCASGDLNLGQETASRFRCPRHMR